MSPHKVAPIPKAVCTHTYIFLKQWKKQTFMFLLGAFIMNYQFHRFFKFNVFRTVATGEFIDFGRP